MSQDISLEEVIKKIVTQTGRSKAEILEKVDEAVKNVNGLLTRVGAALILAEQWHVKIDQGLREINDGGLADGGSARVGIGSLQEGMRNINVFGRVTRVIPSRTFQRKDGKVGKVASVFMQDDTGEVRVTLWDQRAGLADNAIKVGEIIGVYNAYTKKGLDGTVEVHVDNRGMVRPKPDGLDESRFPQVQPGKTVKLADISKINHPCTVEVKVLRKFEPRTFKKRDGGEGKVANVQVGDETGQTRLVFWTENIPLYERLEEGASYKFQDVLPKYSNFSNSHELQVTKSTMVERLDGEVEVAGGSPSMQQATGAGRAEGAVIEDFSKLAPDTFGITVKGKVVLKSNVSKWSKGDREGAVARVTLQDGNLLSVTLVFWTEKINDFESINIGDVIQVTDTYSRDNRGRLELHLRSSSEVKVLGSEKVTKTIKKIGDIKDGQVLLSFKGRVKEIGQERTISLRSGSEVRVMDIIVGDETGQISVTAWRDDVDILKGFNVGDPVIVENVNAKFNTFTNLMGVNLNANSVIKKIPEDEVVPLDRIMENTGATMAGGGAGFSGAPRAGSTRISLDSVQSGMRGEILGYVTRVNKYFNYYMACPHCNKKVSEENGSSTCIVHGKVSPVKRIIAKLTVDDGKGNITVTMIGRTADEFFSLTENEKDLLTDPIERESIVDSITRKFLMEPYVFTGNIKYNDFREEFEMVANSFAPADLGREIDQLVAS